MIKDIITRHLTRSIDLLFLDNPQGTAMGVLLGAVLILLSKITSPLLARQHAITLVDVHPLYFVALGVFLTNLPRLLKGATLPAPIEAKLQYIRKEIRAGGLNRRDAQVMYKELVEQTLINPPEEPPNPGGRSASRRIPA